MSAWTSVGRRIEHQPREYDTGAPHSWWNHDLQRDSFIDVAVAPDNNTLIRLWVTHYDGAGAWIQLTCAQAVKLRQQLQQAILLIPDEVPE